MLPSRLPHNTNLVIIELQTEATIKYDVGFYNPFTYTWCDAKGVPTVITGWQYFKGETTNE